MSPPPSWRAVKKSKLRSVSSKQRRHIAQRAELVPIVWARDKKLCLECGEEVIVWDTESEAVHEVIPKSQFGNKTMHRCFRLANMCLLCKGCHPEAASQASRYRLLVKLRERHGYDYSAEKWASVLRRGEDG